MPPVSPSQGIVRKISSMIRSMESRIARPELRNRGLNIQDRESRGEGIVIGGVSVGREVLPARHATVVHAAAVAAAAARAPLVAAPTCVPAASSQTP